MSREFGRLVGIVERLRQECPWDSAQTHESLRDGFIEETYEAVESIDLHDWDGLRDELGDTLLHILLQTTIAAERGEFSLDDVLRRISEKLIRRHPHIFGEERAPDLQGQKARWETIKLAEGRNSVVDGVPAVLPALQRALRLQEKASKVGFDWQERAPVREKVDEELRELEEAVEGKNDVRISEEYGDVLFALVNYARFIGVQPENALRGTCDRFTRRVRIIEDELRRQGKDIRHATLEEMDAIWNSAKRSGE